MAFLYSLVAGILPALLWLWFWLREDNIHPEPKRRIFITFIGGMLAVIFSIPIEKIILEYVANQNLVYFLWATCEEVLKFAAVFIFAMKTADMTEPIDAVIFMITGALGFAALENSFFIYQPLSSGQALQTIVTGNLRFIGATLLHTVSSATIGLFIAIPYYRGRARRTFDLVAGLLAAIGLHTTFNLFIIKTTGSDTLIVFSCVWVAVVFLMLMFEKVKTVIPPETRSITN